MVNRCNFIYLIAIITLPVPALQAAEITIPNALVKLLEYVETTAREPGPLVEIMVSEGDDVHSGTTLARLDDTEQLLLSERAKLASEIAQKEADNRVPVESAERALKLAMEELRRAGEAVKKFPDTISQQELDRLENLVAQAKLAVLKAQQDVAIADLNAQLKQSDHRLAEANLAKRKIVSPISGMVVRIDAQRGEWVETGRKIFRIVKMDQLRIEAVLEANLAEQLKRNLPVEFRLENNDAIFRGQLTFVSPEVDPFTKKVRVLAVVENPDRKLHPGVKGTLILRPDMP